MAISLLTDIANALSQEFAPRLARQYNRMAVTGAALSPERGMGKNVAWDVEFSGAGAGSYAEGDDVGSGEFLVDDLEPAVLSWGHYRSAFQVSETELDAAATSTGSQGLVQLLEERVMSSMTKLASVINFDMLFGDGTDGSSNPTIVGLLGGALETSGTYAGLLRSSFPEWSGNVLANGGVARPLTVDLMEQMDENIFTASGVRYNLLIGDPGVYRKYSGLFEPLRRVEGTGPISRYDTSVTELFFKGVPFLRDKDLSGSGKVIFLNTEMVKPVYLPISSMSSEDVWKAEQKEGFGSNGDMEQNSLGLPFRIVPLAKSGDSVKFMIKCVLNMKVKRPASCGYIADIAV